MEVLRRGFRACAIAVLCSAGGSAEMISPLPPPVPPIPSAMPAYPEETVDQGELQAALDALLRILSIDASLGDAFDAALDSLRAAFDFNDYPYMPYPLVDPAGPFEYPPDSGSYSLNLLPTAADMGLLAFGDPPPPDPPPSGPALPRAVVDANRAAVVARVAAAEAEEVRMRGGITGLLGGLQTSLTVARTASDAFESSVVPKLRDVVRGARWGFLAGLTQAEQDKLRDWEIQAQAMINVSGRVRDALPGAQTSVNNALADLTQAQAKIQQARAALADPNPDNRDYRGALRAVADAETLMAAARTKIASAQAAVNMATTAATRMGPDLRRMLEELGPIAERLRQRGR